MASYFEMQANLIIKAAQGGTGLDHSFNPLFRLHFYYIFI
jgi:hypothetical protein